MTQDVRYWRLGTRDGDHGPSLFGSMKAGDYMAIGSGLGNLEDITNDEQGKNLLMSRIKNKYSDPDINLNKL